MNLAREQKVVITGIGMVTPLGNNPREVLRRILAGESAAAPPTGFDAAGFGCPMCAEVSGFEAQRYVSEIKMLRLMNRDAQLAVAAARLALADAGLSPKTVYHPEEVALFGATGMAGLPLREVLPLVKVSTGVDGGFDPTRFGQAGLKAVSPLLSFKILSNMPFCFVSINENIQGFNALYSPWEGDGAQAIEAGIRALRAGDARCALAGGCDVKTHELAFATLQQLGLFSSWAETGNGTLPGEGAAFLVLETEAAAAARGSRIYGYLTGFSLQPHGARERLSQTRERVLSKLNTRSVNTLLSSAEGDTVADEQESRILQSAAVTAKAIVCPKKYVGNLFAAAALLQVALGAGLLHEGATSVLANCFGHGNTQAAFVLQKS
jgi:3-oxoacyl-[acyl-carrier-protein] synthase II